MKKHIFKTAATLCTAVLLFAACSIDDPVAGPTIGGGGEEPGPDPDEEILITTDGDFADWDKIPAAKIVSSTVPADAFFPTGKKVKVYAGATYINLYVEFKEDAAKPVQIMHLYIDSDNDQTTGMGNPAWTNDGADILFEGYLVDAETGEGITYDPTIFSWNGENLSGGWDWKEAVAPGLGVCSNSKFVELDNGNKAFEMTILRSAVPGLGQTFRMGVALQYDWNDIAFMPAGSAVDKNGTLEHGPVENLLIGGTGGGSEPETPSNAQITIDGDFADWDALDKKDLFEAVAPADTHYPSARKMRACYNGDYLYVYVEYDGSPEAGVGILDLYMDTDAAFDGNGFATTGVGSWIWNNDGSDLFTQGAIAGDDGNGYNAPIFQYTGTPLAGEWAWTEVVAAGSGAMSGSKAILLDNGMTAVEIALLRSAIPGLGDEIYIGALLEKADWSGECGALPAVSADAQGNYIAADKMHIDFRKRNTGDDPEPDPDPDPKPTESAITIDGNLSDWDAVNDYVATLPADAASNYPAAKKLKVATDKNFIYLYVEYDNSYNPATFRLNVFMDTDMAFDGNGLATTGSGSWMFANDGTEIYLCGLLFDGANPGWSWADVFMYSGTPLAAEWAWTSVVAGGSGATNNALAVDLGGGISAVEASIMRAAIPSLGDKVKLGIYLQNDWTECGILPQGPATDAGEFGAAEKLTIALP